MNSSNVSAAAGEREENASQALGGGGGAGPGPSQSSIPNKGLIQGHGAEPGCSETRHGSGNTRVEGAKGAAGSSGGGSPRGGSLGAASQPLCAPGGCGERSHCGGDVSGGRPCAAGKQAHSSSAAPTCLGAAGGEPGAF